VKLNQPQKKKPFDPTPNFGFGLSTEVLTSSIQTEGDTNMLFTHSSL